MIALLVKTAQKCTTEGFLMLYYFQELLYKYWYQGS